VLRTLLDDLVFCAIDFETADRRKTSACAVAVVRVEAGQIADRHLQLIKPPASSFPFARLHGITAEDVAAAPDFKEVWSDLAPVCEGVHFIAAHNAAFDRALLRVGCEGARVPLPRAPFVCTAELARRCLHLTSAGLPEVCAHLGISLDHHNPLSDAEACARVALATEPRLVEDSLSGRCFVTFGDSVKVRLAPS
jgi:DNA polymerase-3 subunit epsilon